MNILAAMKVPEHQRHCGIYLLVADGIPGAQYVGQTKRTFSKRWSDHVMLLQSGVHHNNVMQQGFAKVGIRGLHACHLIVAPPQLAGNDLVTWLFAWERYFIELYGQANEQRQHH